MIPYRIELAYSELIYFACSRGDGLVQMYLLISGSSGTSIFRIPFNSSSFSRMFTRLLDNDLAATVVFWVVGAFDFLDNLPSCVSDWLELPLSSSTQMAISCPLIAGIGLLMIFSSALLLFVSGLLPKLCADLPLAVLDSCSGRVMMVALSSSRI